MDNEFIRKYSLFSRMNEINAFIFLDCDDEEEFRENIIEKLVKLGFICDDFNNKSVSDINEMILMELINIKAVNEINLY